MLSLKNLNKSYKLKTGRTFPALKNINLDFKYGEFVVIAGRSGSGKTSLLNIIGGLDKYDDGQFYIDGRNTSDYNEADWDCHRRQKVGFIFQHFNLINHLTVYENVELALIMNGLDHEERKKRVFEVLNSVGLEHHIHKKPGYLSGGEQQRAAIARAIINNPDIILADEPTGQLDKKTAIQILDLIKAVSQDKLVIIVTHMEQLLTDYATRIIRINDGIIKDDYTMIDVKGIPSIKKDKTKLKFRDIVNLSIKTVRKKWMSSLSLMLICGFVLGLIMTALLIAKKDVQNDLYHVMAKNVPMNLIEISKSDNSDFNQDDLTEISSLDNIQSVIPVYSYQLYDDGWDEVKYEILPESQNEFYLKDALVCGSYPTETDEVILDSFAAIKLLDNSDSLNSRYQLKIISDQDIWELVKNKTIKLISENGEQTSVFRISGIVNHSVWDYSETGVYLKMAAVKKIIGENRPVTQLKIYIDHIDASSRKNTIIKIRNLNIYYYFEESNLAMVNLTYKHLESSIQFVRIITVILTLIFIISIFSIIDYIVHTRKKEVGILKSLGANANYINILFMLEYLFITIGSIILSYPIGILFTNSFIRYTYNSYAGYGINLKAPIVGLDLITFLLVSSGGLALILISSIIPIHNTAKLPAVDIIRNAQI